MRPICCYRCFVVNCVCVCVCVSVCRSQPRALQKRLNRSRCRLGVWTWVDQRNHEFGGGAGSPSVGENMGRQFICDCGISSIFWTICWVSSTHNSALLTECYFSGAGCFGGELRLRTRFRLQRKVYAIYASKFVTNLFILSSGVGKTKLKVRSGYVDPFPLFSSRYPCHFPSLSVFSSPLLKQFPSLPYFPLINQSVYSPVNTHIWT